MISLGNWKENSRTLLTNGSSLCQTRDKHSFAISAHGATLLCVCMGISAPFNTNKAIAYISDKKPQRILLVYIYIVYFIRQIVQCFMLSITPHLDAWLSVNLMG